MAAASPITTFMQGAAKALLQARKGRPGSPRPDLVGISPLTSAGLRLMLHDDKSLSESETDMNSNPDGQMIRRGIIMLGYHNGAEGGDVLSEDGEVLGYWYMDEEEWSHFTIDGDTEISSSAPSPWMLQDSIADWYETKNPPV